VVADGERVIRAADQMESEILALVHKRIEN